MGYRPDPKHWRDFTRFEAAINEAPDAQPTQSRLTKDTNTPLTDSVLSSEHESSLHHAQLDSVRPNSFTRRTGGIQCTAKLFPNVLVRVSVMTTCDRHNRHRTKHACDNLTSTAAPHHASQQTASSHHEAHTTCTKKPCDTLSGKIKHHRSSKTLKHKPITHQAHKAMGH